jgi:acyl-coenzyme A synthetase/AMP-(fatty) acid ligase
LVLSLQINKRQSSRDSEEMPWFWIAWPEQTLQTRKQHPMQSRSNASDRDLPTLEAGARTHLEYWAERKPDGLAIVGPNLQLTWSQLTSEVNKFAQWLLSQDVEGGVVVDSVDESERLQILGCMVAGIPTVAFDPQLSAEDYVGMGFSTLITTLGTSDFENLRVIAPPIAGFPPVDQGLALESPKPESLARVILTSGTTGKPKAAPFSYSLLAKRIDMASSHYMREQPYLSTVGVRTIAGNVCLFLDVWRGTTNFVPGSPARNIELVSKYGIRGLMGSPTGIDALAKALQKGTTRALQLAEITSAGSFIAPKLAKAASAALGCKITNLYGSTEAGQIAYSNACDDPNNILTPYPGVEISLLGEESETDSDPVPQLLLVKNSYLITGYLTKFGLEPIPEGVFVSGDLGRLLPSGQVEIGGRNDDLINLSGLKIDPRPIEEFTLKNFDVDEAVCVLATNQNGKTFHIMFVVAEQPVDTVKIASALFTVFRRSAPQAVQQVDTVSRNEMGKVPRQASIETHS